MLRLTWADFDAAAARLAELAPAGTRALLPIPRGGLALALALSHRLGLPVLSGLPPVPMEGVALVDEIVDTGKTVDLMRKTLGRPHMPVLAWVARDGVNPVGLYAAAVVPADRWVVFPWEQADAAAVAAEQEAYRAARQ